MRVFTRPFTVPTIEAGRDAHGVAFATVAAVVSARVLGGILERSGDDPVVERLRRRLYHAGTGSLRAVLESHLPAADIEPALALLTGAVLVRVAFEGERATEEFIADLVDHVVR
jgi:hypothetical protein